MNIWQFMSDSPWLTLFLFWIASRTLRTIWIRTMRMIQVRKHGWPPAHLDADGDWKPEPEERQQ